MALFDLKNFNGEVFGAYVDKVPNLNRNELLKSGAIVEMSQYASMLPEQAGGNYITIPIKARIGGSADNYDGGTDITADKRATYTHGRIVVGRAHGWTEKDFSADITGEDFTPATQEVAEYWDDIDQATILATLAGIFAMTGTENLKFVNEHTYNISNFGVDNRFSETTLNSAMQQALGDNKSKFRLAIMHSQIATNLENLKLLSYMKYTDAQNIERDLTLGTLNGRTVLIDDNMPTSDGYFDADADTEGAIKIVENSASPASGEIKLGSVTPYFGSKTPKAGNYVVFGRRYTTYALGEGAIEYTNCGAKVPFEMSRDAKTNGGETTLYSRQRKIFSPYGISFVNTGIISPTDAQLQDGSNWKVANSNASDNAKYFPHKAISIARIITRG
jgi:hypothetical protein